jgi:hypothetical protein
VLEPVLVALLVSAPLTSPPPAAAVGAKISELAEENVALANVSLVVGVSVGVADDNPEVAVNSLKAVVAAKGVEKVSEAEAER